MNVASQASVYQSRIERVRLTMAAQGVDALLLSVGHDLPYLTGYHAMPLERLTMFVLPLQGQATLIIPRLEAPRVVDMPEVFQLLPWNETDDPVALTDQCLGSARTVAVGDQMWARFLVDLLALRPSATYVRAQKVMSALRAMKDSAEIAALVAVGAAADRVALQLQSGQIPLVGRTEAQVSADISARLIAEGHDKVNFAIVAAGENAASPHHHPGSRIIQRGEIVLCDFGGTMNGYCSDITRCVHIGDIPADIAAAYAVLKEAQAIGVGSAVVGATCESVDQRTREVISSAGYGEFFVHRTGHGIGMEEHEDPYMVSGNTEIIAPGHAFSIEPGIYVPGKWGMRLEDIVVATDQGPQSMNNVNHDLVVVDA
jgi:Xaa-Pro aminopeptidase